MIKYKNILNKNNTNSNQNMKPGVLMAILHLLCFQLNTQSPKIGKP